MLSRLPRLPSVSLASRIVVAQPCAVIRPLRFSASFSSVASQNGSQTPKHVSHRFGRSFAAVAAVLGLGLATAWADDKPSKDEKASEEQEKVAKDSLTPAEYTKCKVLGVAPLTHDTNAIFIRVPKDTVVPVSSFLLVRAEVDGKVAERPYTPIIPVKNGVITLAVKSYPDGTVSKVLGSAKRGDEIEIKGMIPKLPYVKGKYKNIALVAGGSGVTPMLQVLSAMKEQQDNDTAVTLIVANHTEKDIWLANDKYPENVKRYDVISKDPAENHLQGRLTADSLKQLLPAPSDDTLVLVCGPPSFMKDISGEKTKDYKQGELQGMLKELGYKQENVFKF